MVKNMSGDTRANQATKIKAVARATAKAGVNKNQTESNVTLKQVIVGVVIACFASVLLAFCSEDFFLCFFPRHKYEPYSPKNVYVFLETATTKAIDYEIYYTKERESWYNEDMVSRIKGKVGTYGYVIKLPVDKIYNLRIDFGQNPGAVFVSDVRLLGTQSMYLADFENYSYNQFDKHSITSKGYLFFSSEGDDPFMIYNSDLF